MINLNKVAKNITLNETGKVEISIAQIKEVIKLMLWELGDYRPSEVLHLIERYNN